MNILWIRKLARSAAELFQIPNLQNIVLKVGHFITNGLPFDGHIRYDGTWAEDSTGTNSTEYATGDNVIEFVIPLQSADPQDLGMFPGMNYQLKFLWWNNIQSGEPSFTSDWNTLWVPAQLY